MCESARHQALNRRVRRRTAASLPSRPTLRLHHNTWSRRGTRSPRHPEANPLILQLATSITRIPHGLPRPSLWHTRRPKLAVCRIAYSEKPRRSGSCGPHGFRPGRPYSVLRNARQLKKRGRIMALRHGRMDKWFEMYPVRKGQSGL